MPVLPDHIYVIGAGRWARTYIKVLLKLVSPKRITIISPNHAQFMEEWIETQNLPLRILNSLPENDSGSKIAIIANAARDHAKTAEILLHRSIPVLIEKPIALTTADVEKLLVLANETGILMAVSHVFLFANYIHRLKRIIRTIPQINRINFIWEDPTSEQRYGEIKRYDATLPIITDIFPHIYSILNFIMPGSSLEYQKYEQLQLSITMNEIPCDISVKRDEKKRTRHIIIETAKKNIELDFSAEPGILRIGNKSYNADPLWHSRSSPLTQQIQAFFTACADGHSSPLLNPQIDYTATQIIDKALNK